MYGPFGPLAGSPLAVSSPTLIFEFATGRAPVRVRSNNARRRRWF
jgi:hypothetical protein